MKPNKFYKAGLFLTASKKFSKLTSVYTMKNRILSGIDKFSTGTSMHGFSELYSTKSMFFTVLWSIVIIISLIITAYQVRGTVNQYINQPEAVSLEPLAPGDNVLYPNLQLCYQHWVYWVDFEAAFKLNFTKYGVLYGLSYLSEIFSEIPFDIEKAKDNFFSTMESNDFVTLTDFFKAISYSTPENGDRYQDITPENTLFRKGHIKLIYQLKMPVYCYTIPGDVIWKQIQDNFNNDSNIYGSMKNINDRKTLSFYIKDDDEKSQRTFVSSTEYNCYVAHYFFAYSDRYLISTEFEKVTEALPRLPMLLYVDEHSTFEVRVHWRYSEVNMRIKGSVYESRNKCSFGQRSTSTNNTCDIMCEAEYNLQNCLCPDIEWSSLVGQDYPSNMCSYKIWFIESARKCTDILWQKQENITNFMDAIAPTIVTNGTKDERFCPTNDFDEKKCCRQSANNSEFRDCVRTCDKSKGCQLWTHEISVASTNSESKEFETITGKGSIRINVLYPAEADILYARKIDIQTWDNFIGNLGGLLGVWTGASLISVFQIFYLCCCAECAICPRKNVFVSVRDKKFSVPIRKNAVLHFNTVS